MKKIATLIATLSLTGMAFAGPVAPMSKQVVEPAPAACEINYNTIEVDWIHTWFDDTNLNDGDGVGASFSYNIIDHLYFTGGGAWETWSADFGDVGVDLDVWQANAGLGGYFCILPNVDFVAEGGVVFYGVDNVNIDDQSFDSLSDNGADFYVKPHLRARFDRFEVQAGATYANIDITNEWVGFAKLYYGLTENWDLAVGGTFGKTASTLNAGVRFRY